MVSIFAKHPPYNNGHLAEVAADMDLAGPPTIRAVEFEGGLFALNGSHRLALACERKLTPKVIVLEQDTGGTEEFFRRVRPTLPEYRFDDILVLRERAFA